MSNYIDALRYMSASTRYQEASKLIIGSEARVRPGTDEYIELAQIRSQARREIIGVSGQAGMDTFRGQREELAQEGYRQ